MVNGPFIDVLPIKMVIFNSYVSLPEGNAMNPLIPLDMTDPPNCYFSKTHPERASIRMTQAAFWSSQAYRPPNLTFVDHCGSL